MLPPVAKLPELLCDLSFKDPFCKQEGICDYLWLEDIALVTFKEFLRNQAGISKCLLNEKCDGWWGYWGQRLLH